MVNNGHTQVRYNTLNNFSSRGIEFSYSGAGALGNRADYNLVTNVNDGLLGGVAIYGSGYLAHEGNGTFGVDNAFGGLATAISSGPERLDMALDPLYELAGSLPTSLFPSIHLYALPTSSGVRYNLTASSPYLHHSEFGAQVGAYNLVESITSINLLLSVSSKQGESYLRNGDTLAGMLTLAGPIASTTDLVFDFSSLDSGYLAANVALTDLSSEIRSPLYWVSYPLSADNSVGDGTGKGYGLTVSSTVNGATRSETLAFNPLTLDNSGPSLSVAEITEGAAITAATVVDVTVTDALIGAHQLEYSLDGGTSWEVGDSHIVLQSAGNGDGYAAAVLIDGVNAVGSLDGINLVEINGGNFTAKSGTFQSFTNLQIPALVTYLDGLPDDTIIALAVKGNGRSTNSTENTNLNNALDAFGFNTSWGANDSLVAIGYKGARKLFSFSETLVAGTGNPLVVDLSSLSNGAMMNTAITLPVDTLGSQALMVRGIDFLGNVGATTTINYSVE